MALTTAFDKMSAHLNKTSGHVLASCPDCNGATTNFNLVNNGVAQNFSHRFQGSNYNRILYPLYSCAVCGRGALAKVHDNGSWPNGIIESFFPFCREVSPLPSGVPSDIVREYREAESCASFGAKRAASALLRSVLEKTLKANGYSKGRLVDKIDQAASDGVITESRRRRAHDEVRVLGNDVLHDDWRDVTDEEVNASHHYAQRILEDFYDQRAEVEKILFAKGRLSPPATASATLPTAP